MMHLMYQDYPDIVTKDEAQFIINHYDEFDDMRINAYNRAINNYTTKHFVDRYLK